MFILLTTQTMVDQKTLFRYQIQAGYVVKEKLLVFVLEEGDHMIKHIIQSDTYYASIAKDVESSK